MVAWLLREHPGAMRADFRRYYNLDLDDVPAGEIWEMVLSMPRGSRVQTLIDPRAAWTDAEYILADIHDILLAIGYGLAGKKGTVPRLARPEKFARDATKGRGPISHEAILRKLEETEWKEVGHASC